MLPTPFTGTFLFVTLNSLYRVTIKDTVSSPVVCRMAGTGQHPPVTGTLRKGMFVGICSSMVAKFDLPNADWATPLPSLGTTGMVVHGITSIPFGFFLQRKDRCEECFERSRTGGTKILGPFDPEWEVETIATLRAIGLRHPCISIATDGPYALPRHILDCLTPPPAPIMRLATNSRGKGSVKFRP